MFRLAILILCQVGGFFVDIQAPSPETSVPGPLSVVLAQDWYQAIGPCSASRFTSQAFSPSFQRSTTLESHWKSNSSRNGYAEHNVSVALHMRKFEREACYPLSALWSTLDCRKRLIRISQSRFRLIRLLPINGVVVQVRRTEGKVGIRMLGQQRKSSGSNPHATMQPDRDQVPTAQRKARARAKARPKGPNTLCQTLHPQIRGCRQVLLRSCRLTRKLLG